MLESIAEFLFELICGLTGHAILWVVTFGRRQALRAAAGAPHLSLFVLSSKFHLLN
jgi:hypothetical protein